MAVPCPRCRRDYDVTLFAFGRTIWCTCGERVGIEHRIDAFAPTTEGRFAADAMLGSLARWLRLLGFDCTYDTEITDEEIVRFAVIDDRTILTRDRRLREEWWIPGIYFVEAESLRDQLSEVVQHFGLASSIRVLTRCSACNRPLKRIPRSAASGRVPSRVFSAQEAFCECPRCHQVYWEGSHADRIRSVADALVSAG